MSTNANTKFEDVDKFLLTQGDAWLSDTIISKFNDLRLPATSDETKHCESLCKIIGDYSKRDAPKRPLSIAMFGPPGSGKTYYVEQLAAHAQRYKEKPVTINLSQFEHPSQLAESLLHALSSRGSHTPLILFDEFDTTLGGEDLGWLRWFLAPMQDAVFFHNGRQCTIPKAVFFFAGGTAERFEDFQQRHASYFVKRKGPDFISRLRGIMNIEGVNSFDTDRILRRALLFQFKIQERAEHLYNKNGTLKITADVLHRLLDGGYYTHGARSVEALLDMCELSELAENGKEFSIESLPAIPLRKLHVSRGPLDGWTVGLSAGLFEPKPNGVIARLAENIISRGANLAYCGTLGSTLETVLDAAEGLTNQLIPCDPDYRIWQPAPYPSFHRPGYGTGRSEKVNRHVKFEEIHTLAADEKQELSINDSYFEVEQSPNHNINHHLAWSLSLFRMRVRFAQQIDALVVVGGKGGLESELSNDLEDSNSDTTPSNALPWGRFPGVAEEVMLALAFNKPVYILGMLNGAAKDVGVLLGLSNTQLFASSCLPQPTHENHLALMERLLSKTENFLVAGKHDLPQSYDDLRDFFRRRALNSDRWIWNGLTRWENHDLFNATRAQIDNAVQTTIRGISHLHWRRRELSSYQPARGKTRKAAIKDTR